MTEDRPEPTYAAMTRMTTIGTIRIGAIAMLLAIGGCVNISAPDKPIEINLNIRVTQEVIYRLENSTKELIQQNPNIF